MNMNFNNYIVWLVRSLPAILCDLLYQVEFLSTGYCIALEWQYFLSVVNIGTI
jgi:hypothetical protein